LTRDRRELLPGRVAAAHASLGADETGELTVAAGKAAELEISPATLTLSADDGAVLFTATGTDADGNPTTDLGPLSWSILSGPITGIDPSTGSFDPGGAGSGTVGVSSGYGPAAVSGTITVTPGRAAALVAAPDTLSISADAAPVTFTATGADADGNPTTDLGTLTWTIASGPITAIAAATGDFDPVAAGSGTVRVSSSHGPSDDTGSIQVLPGQAAALVVAPDTLTIVQGDTAVGFVATGADGDGNPTTDLGTLTWSIASGPIAAIHPATGLFTPTVPGTGAIRATSSHGPSDATGAVTVLQQATLVGDFTSPASVNEDQSFTLVLTVDNTGESDAAGVAPCGPVPGGTSSAVVTAGPTPPSAAIAAGGSAAFSWTITPGLSGSLSFTGCAAGTDAATGAPVATGNVGSDAIAVQQAAALDASLSIPDRIPLGGSFTVTMDVTNSGQATATGVAPGALTTGGSGAASLVTGPSPASAVIAGGGAASFQWTYRAEALGTLQLSGAAAGTDANEGTGIGTGTVSSNLADIVDVTLLASDPLGDGTSFAFVFGHAGRIYVGPRASGAGAVRFLPDGSAPESVSFAFPRDTTGNSSQNNSAPPYPSIGRTLCNDDTHECGPDNEDGRGLFTSGVIAGTGWLVVGGARSGGDLDYVYMTPDTGTSLDFRYVDLSQGLGGGTEGFSAMHVFTGRVYLGFPDTGGSRPYLLALITTPASPGLDAQEPTHYLDLEGDKMPRLSTAGNAIIDTFQDFGSRLYLANAGAWIRSTTTLPGPYGDSPGHWAVCMPSAAAYTAKTSLLTAKTANLEPADRAVPQMASFKGRLYAARNTTAGPQLWGCNPATGGSATDCDPGDWFLVAANSSGDLQLSQFNNPGSTRIALLAATPDFLYVGYDNPSGIQVFRTSSATPLARADFEGELAARPRSTRPPAQAWAAVAWGYPATSASSTARRSSSPATPPSTWSPATGPRRSGCTRSRLDADGPGLNVVSCERSTSLSRWHLVAMISRSGHADSTDAVE
jgi:hypothetical protein